MNERGIGGDGEEEDVPTSNPNPCTYTLHMENLGGKDRYCPKHWEERKKYLTSISSSKGAKAKNNKRKAQINCDNRKKKKSPPTATTNTVTTPPDKMIPSTTKKPYKYKVSHNNDANIVFVILFLLLLLPHTHIHLFKHSYTTILILTQVDEIVHAKWTKTDRKKFAAQVLAVKNYKYKLFFLDNNIRLDVPESEIKGLSKKQKADPLLNKRFYDGGEVSRDPRKRFRQGEFVVLARAIMKVPEMTEVCYWCERQTSTLSARRDVVLFGKYHVMNMLKKQTQ